MKADDLITILTGKVDIANDSKGPLRLKVCLKSEMGHVYKLGRDVEKLVDVVYKLGSSFGEVFGIGVIEQLKAQGVAMDLKDG
ncbi:hypothetical protein Tco_1236909 [Tanacetum coccineum]